jgi:pyruvate/2-oxoglutarate dehydrogenase complex dihydrolipoamide dehydrogenase (E3) component/uncharacterized membrane protein YdjX (TVP38/TMEM64 family)
MEPLVGKRAWAALALVALIAIAYHALGAHGALDLQALRSSHAQGQAWRDAEPALAALSFFALYVAVAALSLPGVAVLTLGAGALFGLAWGTVIASFASTIGATLAFLASRWLLGDWVRTRFGARLATLNAGVARDGGFYLFGLRLLPVLPFFAINLAMGLTPMRIWTFYWTSQLGMLAGTLVYVNAGTQLARLHSLSQVASPAVWGALALLGVLPAAARKLVPARGARESGARWQRPRRFDRNLIVIGGGAAGLVTAYVAAAMKAKVTLVERHRMGGDCLNTGCVPSKALIRSTRFLAQARRAGELGLRAMPGEANFAEVMARVQRVVQTVEPHDSPERFRALGVDVAEGEARLATPWEVEIRHHDGRVQRLSARSIVIAAGARPTVPPIPGIEQVQALTSDTVWQLRELPHRLLVLGGGPVGCELALAFARLGAQVSLVEKAPRLLMREDAEVCELVAARMREEGMKLFIGHAALRFEKTRGEQRLWVRSGEQETGLPFDALLVAVGRSANLQGYGLQELDIATGRTIEVNGYLQTSFPHIYAAGDVAGPYQFTHAAGHQAWYAAVNALLRPWKQFKVDDRVMPAVTFVEPEIARVGLNEQEARERGIVYEVTRYDLAELDRAITDGAAHGFVKVLTPPGRDRILGVTIAGEHAGELIAEWVLAMKHGLGLGKLLGTIHAYPTWAEANKYAAGQWRQAHLPPRLLGWAQRWHDWRRG